jgi:MFS family permease
MTSTPSDSPVMIAAPAGNGRFLRVCASRGLSGVAFQMISVAIGWHLYLLTGNTLDLGLVGLAQFVPGFIASPLAGYVADSFERRRVVAICQLLGAVCAVMLLIGVAGGWLGRGGIFGIIALLGAVRAFEFPTLSSLLPLLVDRSELSRAVSLYSSANQTAVVVGPASAGILIAINPTLAYGVAAALCLCAALLIATLGPTSQQIGRARLSFETLAAGARFIGRTPDLLGAITLDVAAFGLAGVVAILPAFVRDVLHGGPEVLGFLRAAPAIGAIGMALVLAKFPITSKAGAKMFAGVVLFGVATCGFGFARSLPVALLALIVLGAADVMSVVVRQSMVQLRTPDEMRGRVGAVNSMAISASNQLGDFRAGAMASAIGLEAAIVVGGLSAIAIALIWARAFPALPKLDRLEG